MKKAARIIRTHGKTIALVPTMGYLHEGHLSLMQAARSAADVVIISIFVNPTQFGPNEDFERYPRDFQRDQSLALNAGVDIIFYPDTMMMYPSGYQTFVEVQNWSTVMCGASRPGHFRGVCTIVLKLFSIIQPDIAFFGWKDAQQYLILRKMSEDLNLDVKVVAAPIVRESDGLAMSSRNVYLSPSQRKQALVLFKSLEHSRKLIEDGEDDSATILDQMKKMIETAPEARIDYISIVSLNELKPLQKIDFGNTLIALAVFFGKTRLIDNIRI